MKGKNLKMIEEPGTLQIGEYHPAADSAFKYIKAHLSNPFFFSIIRESIASCALSGNRLAEVCHETLRRIENNEPVSDRYLLGLAWFVRDLTESECTRRSALEELRENENKPKGRKKNAK